MSLLPGQSDAPTTIEALLAGGESALAALRTRGGERACQCRPGRMPAWKSARVRANPGKILCVGLNYAKHAAEGGMAPPETPVLFSKFNNTIAAPGEDIPLPPVAVEYDYEVELVAVMGKTTKNVSVEDALDTRFRLLHRQRCQRPRPANAAPVNGSWAKLSTNLCPSAPGW